MSKRQELHVGYCEDGIRTLELLQESSSTGSNVEFFQFMWYQVSSENILFWNQFDVLLVLPTLKEAGNDSVKHFETLGFRRLERLDSAALVHSAHVLL